MPTSPPIRKSASTIRRSKSADCLEALALFAIPLLLGAAKVQVGMERHKPVGILVVLIIMTAIIALFHLIPPRLTRAGREALAAEQARNARAARAPLENELMLAVALTGLVVLSGTPYAALYAAATASGGGGGCGGRRRWRRRRGRLRRVRRLERRLRNWATRRNGAFTFVAELAPSICASIARGSSRELDAHLSTYPEIGERNHKIWAHVC
jgi:heme A synthase